MEEALRKFKYITLPQMKEALESEEGDTNFISIIIILAIVIVLAGVFIAMGRHVVSQANSTVNNFKAPTSGDFT